MRRIGGEQVIQGLISKLSDKTGDARDTDMFALAVELCDERAALALSDKLPILYGACEAWKPEDTARRKIIEAMAKAGNPRAIAVLHEALGDDDKETRLWAAEALGSEGGRQAELACVDILRDYPIGRSERAAEVLGRIARETAVPDLLETMKDVRFEMRWHAAKALRGIEVKTLASGLLRALSHNDEFVRRRAAEVVAYYRCDDDTVGELSRLATSDASEAVRNAAAKAQDRLERSRASRAALSV